MDKFERTLKQDATMIEADVSPQLADRIDASLYCAARELPVNEPANNKLSRKKQRLSLGNLWWASSLTGLVAVVSVILLLNGDRDVPGEDTPIATTVPAAPDHREYLAQLQQSLPLTVEKVEFTEGLEQEMRRLRADLERAKANVSRDIDFTF